MTCREDHPELIEERKKSDLPEKPKTPQQLWYNHEKKAYMKVHPEVPQPLSEPSRFASALHSLTIPPPCLSPGESEGAEGGTEETVVAAVRQEEAQVDQQGPGAAERLRGTRTGLRLAQLNQTGLNKSETD